MGETLAVPNVGEIINGSISLPADCHKDFRKAVKIALYKKMLEKGILSFSQFDILMQIQSERNG